MKKAVITIFSVSLLATMLSSCGGEDNTASSEQSSATEATVENTEAEAAPEASLYAEGKTAYDKACLACHQADGTGITGAFPPLAGSDYLLEDKTRAIRQVMYGSEGEITVNGETFNGIMPPQSLNDQEIKDVINYILNSWGNDGGEVSIEEVHALRVEGAE